MNVYERVEKLRKERGISSQGKLEKELGFSNGSISKWKKSAPTPERLQKIATYFDVSLEYLLNGDESAAISSPAPDPFRAYYDRLEAFLQESPEHRALVDSAAHVRTEDAEIVLQLLARFADPDSAAPELPGIENAKKSLRTANNSCERTNNDADEIELTAETLKRVTNSPEVLAEDAAYIKSRRNAEKKALSSSRTTSEGRKSG